MFLNADVPRWQCWVRSEHLYDLVDHHGEFTPVVVFGITSRPGYAVGFHVMTNEGAVIYRLPVTALVHDQAAPNLPLDHLQLWGCFSTEVGVHEFDWLAKLRVKTVLKDRKWYDGRYMFTLDWTGSPEADGAGEIGHKCGHLLALDIGVYAIQPNNRIAWYEPSFVTRPFADTLKPPHYRTNTHEWHCEREHKWLTEDSPAYFYDVTPGDPMDPWGTP